MRKPGRAGRTVWLVPGIALVLGLVTAASPAQAVVAAGTAAVRGATAAGTPGVRRVCPAPRSGYAACMALLRPGGPAHRGLFTAGQAPRGYGPRDLWSAYDLPSATAGAGQTVAVVDAYNDPDAEADLQVYRAQYGLPGCDTASGCFRQVNQYGQASPLPPDAGSAGYPSEGWDVEESLDVDMVSAICPRCHIILVEANSSQQSDLSTAEDTAVSLGAKFVSNSWDGAENADETADDQYFDHPGVAITVAAGDFGYGAYYPAASRYVTAVGGTALRHSASAPRGWTETVWGNSRGLEEGTGSGCSAYEPKPPWQHDTGCANRTIADVSAVASPWTPVAMYDTYSQGGWLRVGGTSVASPLIASVYALAGTPVTGSYPSSYPYAAEPSGLNDVTEGTNGTCSPAYLCTAGPGYDGPTGWGTPDGVTAFTAPGAHGNIAGQVTDAVTGAPVAGATVSAGQGYTVTTSPGGDYELIVPVGRYNLTATAYGYRKAAADDVQASQGHTATADLALPVAPTVTLSGTVTDGSGHGWPLYTKITVEGTPTAPAYTSPYTGAYRLSLPQRATYHLQFTSVSRGYQARDLTVHLGTAARVADVKVAVDTAACRAEGYAYGPFSGIRQAFTGWSGRAPHGGWTLADDAGNGETWNFSNPGGQAPPPGGHGRFASVDSALYQVGNPQDTTLTSPLVNLSGVSNPQVTFDNYSVGYGYGTQVATDVELSLDGGQTWTTVWSPATQPAASLVRIPVPQAAGEPDVQVRFHYTAGGPGASSNQAAWEIDDVTIGGRNCALIRGGLVAGQVRDANTRDALDGVTVASPAQSATTAHSPAAAGFYELFAVGSGRQEVTAKDGAYAPATERVNVVANAVSRQDFVLQAGYLTVKPGHISVTQTMGAAATATLSLTNTGTQPAAVQLGEEDGTSPPGGDQARAMAARWDRPAPAGTSWTAIASYPTPISGNAVAADGGEVYSVGGALPGGVITAAGYAYDPAAGSWSPIADAPAALEGAAGAVVNGIMYLAGGWNEENALTTVDAYNPAYNSWSQVAPLPTATAFAAAAVVNGQLYVIGGCATASCAPALDLVYSYNPVSNIWTRHASYPAGPVAYASCAGLGGKLACAGGIGAAGGTPYGSTWIYDPVSGTWSQGAAMPYAAWGAAYAAADGQLVISGGATGSATELTAQSAAYDQATNTWTSLPGTSTPAYLGGGACGYYTIGGATSDDTPEDTAEVLSGYGQCGTATWLSESQQDFEVAPGQTVHVTVTLDASQVSRPGTYTAELTVGTSTPYTLPPVTVTMRVRPTQP